MLLACLLLAMVAVSLHTATLLVVNQGDKTVSVVDAVVNKEIRVIDQRQTSMHGHEIAIGPDPTIAFLPIYSNTGVGGTGEDGHEMLAIDWTTANIVGRTDFGHGVRPHCVEYDPVKQLLYVSTELDDAVTIVDPKTYKVVGTIPTGAAQSHMVAITRDGKRAFTSNVSPGSVSVLDLDKRELVKVIPISDVAQRITISGDGRWAFTSDQTNATLAVIDTRSLAVTQRIQLPGNGFGGAGTSDGKWLLMPIPSKDIVVAIDLQSMTITKTIPVEKAPQEVLIRPDGKFAYVAGAAEKKVSVIDLSTWKMSASIEVGNYPDGLAWSE